MNNTTVNTNTRKYDFSRKTVTIDGEKFYSYSVKDFTGKKYLIPIDRPVDEEVTADNCQMLTYKKALEKFMAPAFQKESEKNIHLTLSFGGSSKSIYAVVEGVKRHIIGFDLEILNKENTIEFLGNSSIEKLRSMEDFTKLLFNDSNKEEFEKLIKSIHRKEDDNPFTAWWEEQDELKISKDTWGSL